MKLTTDYREQAVGTLKGSKEYYLVGTVNFTNEERTVAQERGLYDIYVNVPAATAPPTRGGDFLSMAMRGVGLILTPIGLLYSCVGSLAHSNSAGPLGMLLFFVGLGLFIVGKLRGRLGGGRGLGKRGHQLKRRYGPIVASARLRADLQRLLCGTQL
ncbi:MAG TPA: hypothetical protein VMV19_03850 [Xanthobacteraceae bacterium]|nr:hypothetical protein [Xanthobacteraceae bacterium]